MGRKAILVHLDQEVVRQVDQAATFMHMTRTAYLRESINRNLRFFDLFERKSHERIRQQANR